MDKAKMNYFIDVLMALAFFTLFVTGILKFPRLLPSLGISYSRLPMNLVSQIHDWSGIILGILVFLHLALHCKWLWTMTKNLFMAKVKNK